MVVKVDYSRRGLNGVTLPIALVIVDAVSRAVVVWAIGPVIRAVLPVVRTVLPIIWAVLPVVGIVIPVIRLGRYRGGGGDQQGHEARSVHSDSLGNISKV